MSGQHTKEISDCRFASADLQYNSDKSKIYNQKSKIIIMSYSEKVIGHYQNPKNVGTLDKSAKNVEIGRASCRERVSLVV